MSNAAITIRHGESLDLEALTGIYNHYVRHSVATFDTLPLHPEARRGWFTNFSVGTPHQLWVATRNNAIIGYACSSQYRSKPAYDSSVETSVYLHPDELGAGLGHALYKHLFDHLAAFNLHRAYAGIAQPNPASVALHQAFNFKRIGTFSQAGHKFGGYHDVDWYEKSLEQQPDAYEKTT